jgi:hypothetical protein
MKYRKELKYNYGRMLNYMKLLFGSIFFLFIVFPLILTYRLFSCKKCGGKLDDYGYKKWFCVECGEEDKE